MALDLLSIPLMPAECERVFSSAKTLVTDRMKADIIIEACTILRHYYKEKLRNRLRQLTIENQEMLFYVDRKPRNRW